MLPFEADLSLLLEANALALTWARLSRQVPTE